MGEPDGATTADTLIEDATASDTHFVHQDITKAASALDYSMTVFVKVNERTELFLSLSDTSFSYFTVVGD